VTIFLAFIFKSNNNNSDVTIHLYHYLSKIKIFQISPYQIIKSVARKGKLEIPLNILSRTFRKIRSRQDYIKVMKEKE